MAQIPYRANLSTAVFPMTIAKAGRTVINPGLDQNFDKRVDPGASYGSVGIPQVMYCENVLPTSEGYQSIGSTVTGTIDEGNVLTVETIRLAVEVDETSVVTDIDIEDEGDQMDILGSPWVTTENVGGAHSRFVYQDEDDGNPLPSYTLEYDENEALPAVMHRHVGTSVSTEFEYDFDFKVDAASAKYQVIARFMTSPTGVGPALILNESPVVAISYGQYWRSLGYTTLTSVIPAAPLTLNDWYHAHITMNRGEDLTWTITATITDSTAAVYADLIWNGNTTAGDQIGFVAETSFDEPSGVMHTWVDNLHVVANVPDVDYTSVAGITNIDIAFYDDDTAKYSHGNVDNFENLDVQLPAGFESPLSPDKFSTASVRGSCYVCIINADDSTHIYRVTYDSGTTDLIFTEVTATISTSLGLAFNMDNIVGLSGSYNYLVLLTPDSVIWSSTTNTLDFAPSLVSGAGSERVGNLKGDINFAREHVAGLLLYTNGNVVSMLYTGNARYPWKFREVDSSAGYTYSQQVAGDTNSNDQYGLSNARTLQSVAPAGAQIIAAEASNFFERTSRWDNFDPATNVFTVRSATGSYNFLDPNQKYRVWYVLDRYILVAYEYVNSSDAEYNNLLVFDTLLKRYGKIRQAFNTVLSNEYGFFLVDYLTRQKSKVILDTYAGTHAGVLLLGKFAVQRDKFLTMDELNLESQDMDGSPASFDVFLYPTLNGNKFQAAVAATLDTVRTDDNLKSYNARCSGQNICVLVKGTFDLNTLEMRVHQDGDR